MLCTGNSLELCGAGGALSVYTLNSDAPVSTNVQGSTTVVLHDKHRLGNRLFLLAVFALPPMDRLSQIRTTSLTLWHVLRIPTLAHIQCPSKRFILRLYGCLRQCRFVWMCRIHLCRRSTGQWSGTCYLKNSQGSFSAAGNNLVSGFRTSSGSMEESLLQRHLPLPLRLPMLTARPYCGWCHLCHRGQREPILVLLWHFPRSVLLPSSVTA